MEACPKRLSAGVAAAGAACPAGAATAGECHCLSSTEDRVSVEESNCSTPMEDGVTVVETTEGAATSSTTRKLKEGGDEGEEAVKGKSCSSKTTWREMMT